MLYVHPSVGALGISVPRIRPTLDSVYHDVAESLVCPRVTNIKTWATQRVGQAHLAIA